MALLFMDGFGGGDASTGKWDPSSANYTPQTASPRLPGSYYASYGAGSNIYKTIPASSKIILGVGFSESMTGTSGTLIFYGDGGGTAHITLQHNQSTGHLEVYRGSTLIGTGMAVIPRNSWCYIEISVTISDTVGEIHVRLNGAASDEITFVGDTKNGGTATTIDMIRFSGGWSGGVGSFRIADLYVLNDTGTTNNDFLGDVAVRTLSPNGNGTYSQLVGSDSDSVDNYQLVDEHPYATTDYVGSASTGDKDSYLLEDLPVGVTNVYAVQVAGKMLKSDASLGQARYIVRSGGIDYPGTTQALSTSAIGYYELYETDPATSIQWTPTGVNDLEAGMEVM